MIYGPIVHGCHLSRTYAQQPLYEEPPLEAGALLLPKSAMCDNRQELFPSQFSPTRPNIPDTVIRLTL